MLIYETSCGHRTVWKKIFGEEVDEELMYVIAVERVLHTEDFMEVLSMSEKVKLVIHHGGRWENVGTDNMVYVGGAVKEYEAVDKDFLCYFTLSRIPSNLGYVNPCQVWCKVWGLSGEIGYAELTNDVSVLEMLEYNKQYPHHILFYVEMVPLTIIDVDNHQIPVVQGIIDEDGSEEDDSEDGGSMNGGSMNGDSGDDDNNDEDFEDAIYREAEIESSSDDESDDTTNQNVVEDFTEFDEPRCDDDDDDGFSSLKGSSDEDEPRFPEFNEVTDMKDPNLCVGMRFANVYVFRKALKEWAVKRGFDYVFEKNTTKIVSAMCKVKCGFKVRASLMRNTSTFQIKTFLPMHSCPRENINRLVTSVYIKDKFLDEFRDNPNWEVEAIQKKVQRELGASVHIAKCYRAKRRAKKHFEGDAREQYRRLYDYAETLKNANPGSLIKIQTEMQYEEGGQIVNGIPRELVIFQYMYVRFAAQKKGYISGIRPLIGLDGCFLKTPMGGQLLSAVAKDGNDNMFPLAFAMVDSECKASWEWFLKLLIEDFGAPSDTQWVFMSDQQKGLVEAINTLMPGVEHRFCVKHMYENMKIKFKGIEYKKLLWRAASACTTREWEHHMSKLKDMDEEAYNWVLQHDPNTWARCKFSTRSKSASIENNISESFNAYIRKARDLHVLGMYESIMNSLMMKRFHVKYQGMQRYEGGNICPQIQIQLEKSKIKARNCFCTAAGRSKYSVQYFGTISVVNLVDRTCTCRMWDLMGIPCKHVIAAICSNRETPEQYVDKCYSKSVYLQVYDNIINPIPSEEHWDRTELPDIHPWVVKKPAGRPKKRRNRRADEPKDPNKVTKLGGIVTCGLCNKEGHNARGCTTGVTGETTWQKRMRMEKNKRLGNHPEVTPSNPRKRGRPSMNTSQAGPSNPSKRGRPSKNSSQTGPSNPRKRGRPSKNTSQTAPSNSQAAPSNPRKRGRPINNSSQLTLNATQQAATQQAPLNSGHVEIPRRATASQPPQSNRAAPAVNVATQPNVDRNFKRASELIGQSIWASEL